MAESEGNSVENFLVSTVLLGNFLQGCVLVSVKGEAPLTEKLFPVGQGFLLRVHQVMENNVWGQLFCVTEPHGCALSETRPGVSVRKDRSG